MSDKEKIMNLSPLKKIEGINIDNDRLMVYVVNFLHNIKVEPTFDKIVVVAFKLFPERFSLVGFEEYPDAKRVHDCLFHCTYKTKGWLFGNPQSGYKLTKKGNYYLEEAEKIIKEEIKLPKEYKTKVRRKEKNIIDQLKKTEAYKKHLVGEIDNIETEEIKIALRLPKYSSYKDFENNLKKLLGYAKEIKDKLAIDFLEFVNKNKEGFFEK